MADEWLRHEQAKEALRLAEDAELRGVPEPTQMVAVSDPLRERWDCESVLSMRSNLDNHPARIAEPAHSRKPRLGFGAPPDVGRPARIVLSAKTGLPVRDADRAGARRQGGQVLGPVDGAAGAPPTAQLRKGETQEQKKARKTATKEANVRCRPQRLCLLTVLAAECVGRQIPHYDLMPLSLALRGLDGW